MIKKLMMLAAACAALGAWADTETAGGYTWSYLINGDTAEIYNDGYAAISPAPTGAVTIPSTLGGKPVTSIGMEAFKDCVSLTSVTIPNSVTSVGPFAFDGCSGLTSVTIPEGVTSIGEYAFQYCSGLTSVKIPDSVTRIKSYAFKECNESLFDTTTIPGVKLVDGWAIGNTGLSGDLDLTGIRGIAGAAFDGCSGLTSVKIPEGVTSIGMYAFYMCSGLTSVTIPDSVTDIGEGAFGLCSVLKSVKIPDGVTDIGNYTFERCSVLESVTIPDSVTSIGYEAFNYCIELTSVTMPNNITNVGGKAFADCYSLTEIMFDGNAPTVGEDAFLSVNSRCTAYVLRGSTGWGVDIPGTWNGIKIDYRDDQEPPPPGGTPGGVLPPRPAPPCYEVLNEADIAEAYAAPKAVVLQGAAYDGCDVVGIVELKLGKVNANKMTSKIGGTVTLLDGKKYAITAQTAPVDGAGPASGYLPVKKLGMMHITIGGGKFAGELNGWHLQSANVGGDWTKADATATVDADDLSMFAGRVLTHLLPDGEPATVKGGKWTWEKAATVKWAKPKKGEPLPEIADAEAGKGLFVDTTKGKSNLSGLKLTYTPKKGTFKGSFKVYALEGEKTKLKKYTIKVSGVVVGGVGYGEATSKKPVLAWSVTVR